MEIPIAAPRALLADKGYDGERFRKSLLIRGAVPIIPTIAATGTARIERVFGKLKHQRRIATRYEKSVLSSESFFNLASARQWRKSFVDTA